MAATVEMIDRCRDLLVDRRDVPPPNLTFWAAMSLRQVDWVIRHFGPAEVERELSLAETRMPL